MDVCTVSYKTYWGECRRMLLPSLANILHTLKGAQLPLIYVPRASPSHLLQSAQQGYRLGMGGRCTRHIKVIINRHSEWYHPSLIW